MPTSNRSTRNCSAAGYRTLRLAVFDQMLPRIAHYWRRSEVEELMRAQSLKEIEIVSVNEMSWAARGVKPRARLE
jgi:hypothetical protein